MNNNDNDDGRTHYQVFGLTEAASTRAIKKAFLIEDWYRYDDVASHSDAARRREKAFFVLGDPVRRAVYDREQGFSQEHLTCRIASQAGWGTTWALLLGLLALLFFFDHDNLSRMFGSKFAPDYREVVEYIEGEVCQDTGYSERCADGRFESTFHSSSGSWDWALNSWLALSLLPATIIGAVAYVGYILINRVLARIVASVRYMGHSDTWIRIFAWLVVIMPPITLIIYTAKFGAGWTP